MANTNNTPQLAQTIKRLAPFSPRTNEMVAPFLFLVVFIIAVVLRPGEIDPITYARSLAEDILRNGTGRALLAVGAGLVLASSGVDLSIAGVLALSGILFASATQSSSSEASNITLLAFAFISFSIGALVGSFNGWAIAKWKAPPLILTWSVGAISLILAAVFSGIVPRQGDAQIQMANASGVPIASFISDLIYEERFLSVSLAFLVILLPALVSAFNIGRNACAVGANCISATYGGIRVRRVLVATYAASGALAALAGVWLALLERKAMTATYAGVELSAIAIAVLGGTAMSGGYFSVIPIVSAAFLWSLLLGTLQRPDLLPNFFDSQMQGRAAEAAFALLLISVSILGGRRLRGDTVTINVISRLEE